MAHFPTTTTLGEALRTFYAAHNLGEEGGINKRWAKLKVGKFYIPFPNTQSRKKALLFHDVHHIVTGYDSDWKGEVSISAWEIASGCREYYAAWVLDLWGMAVGLVLYPKAVFQSFVRGKRTLNLYGNPVSHDQLVSMQIGVVQRKLLLEQTGFQKATSGEIVSFLFWTTVSVLSFVVPFVLPYVVIGYSLHHYF